MYKFWYTNETKPSFCTKCKSNLTKATLSAGFDAYTGKEAHKDFIACPLAVKALLDTYHDVWEVISYEVQDVSGHKSILNWR